MARRTIKHLRRYEDAYSVKGVLTVHPPKPTLAKAEHIGEGVLDWQDLVEQARCLDDGLVIEDDWLDLTKPPRAPFRTESADYDVRIKHQRIAAKVEVAVRAKVERHYTSAQPARYGSLIQVRTRR